MMNRRRKNITFALMLASMLVLMMVGCSTEETAYRGTDSANNLTASKPVIAATNVALQNMAAAIVGDFADVIRPQVQSHAQGGLDTQAVLRMQSAAVVLTNGPGADDASWLNLISLNESRVFATTSAEFELTDFIQVQDYRTVHSHGDEGEHSHPWLVPHCWLDPRLAAAQSLAVLNRLTEAFPDQETNFSANYQSLKQELASVEELAEKVGELIAARGITVIASDPRLLFFTRSLNSEDNYFLWFDPPEVPKAVEELNRRQPKGEQRLLLLCPNSAGSLAEQLPDATGIKTAIISLIEEGVEGGNTDGGNADPFVLKLRDNYLALKAAAEGMKD